MSFQSGRIAGPVMLIAAFLSTVHPNIKLDTELLFFWAKWPPPRIKVTVNLGPPSPHLSWYQRTTNKYLLQISRARPRHCTSTSNTPTKCKVDRTNIKKKHTYKQTYRQLQPSQGFLSFEDNSSVTPTCPFAVVQIVTPAWWRYILHISVHIQWSVSYSASLLLPVQKKCIERSEGGCCTKLLNLSQIWWSGR